MSGRPPKPTALRLIEGNPGKRAVNGNEPEPSLLDNLTPPAHLSERSAEVWRQVAPMLRKVGVLTEMDVLALELLCDAVSDYRLARAECGDKFVTFSSKGSQMVSQWMVAKQMSSKRAEAFMSRFGMDPVSRSKVMIEPQGDLFGKPPSGPERFFRNG